MKTQRTKTLNTKALQANTIAINIYCVGGEIGFGDASTSDPRGYFMVSCGEIDNKVPAVRCARVDIVASPGVVAPTVSASMDIFAKKCEHVRVNGPIIYANFGWLLSIAHYIKAKYTNTIVSEQEKEFLATQLSGYGPGYLQHHISQSRCAAYYLLAG
jgi:hypothetical protein